MPQYYFPVLDECAEVRASNGEESSEFNTSPMRFEIVGAARVDDKY